MNKKSAVLFLIFSSSFYLFSPDTETQTLHSSPLEELTLKKQELENQIIILEERLEVASQNFSQDQENYKTHIDVLKDRIRSLSQEALNQRIASSRKSFSVFLEAQIDILTSILQQTNFSIKTLAKLKLPVINELENPTIFSNKPFLKAKLSYLQFLLRQKEFSKKSKFSSQDFHLQTELDQLKIFERLYNLSWGQRLESCAPLSLKIKGLSKQLEVVKDAISLLKTSELVKKKLNNPVLKMGVWFADSALNLAQNIKNLAAQTPSLAKEAIFHPLAAGQKSAKVILDAINNLARLPVSLVTTSYQSANYAIFSSYQGILALARHIWGNHAVLEANPSLELQDKDSQTTQEDFVRLNQQVKFLENFLQKDPANVEKGFFLKLVQKTQKASTLVQNTAINGQEIFSEISEIRDSLLDIAKDYGLVQREMISSIGEGQLKLGGSAVATSKENLKPFSKHLIKSAKKAVLKDTQQTAQKASEVTKKITRLGRSVADKYEVNKDWEPTAFTFVNPRRKGITAETLERTATQKFQSLQNIQEPTRGPFKRLRKSLRIYNSLKTPSTSEESSQTATKTSGSRNSASSGNNEENDEFSNLDSIVVEVPEQAD